LDIGQVPDRPSTPSTASEASSHTSQKEGGAKPRASRPEDLADGEEKPIVAPVKKSADKSKARGTTSQKDKGPRDKDKDQSAAPSKPKGSGSYVRPENVKKDKMSPEDLAVVMERMKLQNDKIRQQRERVEADEDAFNIQIKEEREQQKKAREEQRARDAAQRKLQADINQERDANAKRKLERMAQREWDSQKHEKPAAKERVAGNMKGLGRSGASSASPAKADSSQPSKSPSTPEEPPRLPELSLGKTETSEEWVSPATSWK